MKYLLMVVLLFSFNQARAVGSDGYFVSGSELLERCEAYLGDDTNANIASGNACAGYVEGIVDEHNTFVNWGEIKPAWWCVSKHSNLGQLIHVVTKYLQEHPEDLHQTASGLTVIALTDAFPCE